MNDILGKAFDDALKTAGVEGSCKTCGGIEMAREAVIYHDIYTPALHCPECGVLTTNEGKPVGTYTWDGKVFAMTWHEEGVCCQSMGHLWEKPLGKWTGPRT